MTIVEVLDELGVRYQRKGEGSSEITEGWVGVPCNRCGGGRPKLGFPLDGRVASCWSCGPRSVASAIVEITGRPYAEILPLLEGIAPKGFAEPFRGRYHEPYGVGPLLSAHRRYLRGRGFRPDELVRLWGVGGIGHDGGALAWRVFIPVTFRGERVSWQARAIAGNNAAKYRGAPPADEAVPARRTLYGLDYSRHAAVVFEGAPAVWRVGPGAVATMGLAYTQAQVAKLALIPRRVIAFDSEPAAQARGRELARQLEVFPGRTEVAYLDSGKSADEASESEVRQIRRCFLGG